MLVLSRSDTRFSLEIRMGQARFRSKSRVLQQGGPLRQGLREAVLQPGRARSGPEWKVLVFVFSKAVE